MGKSKPPTTYAILFVLIVLVAAMIWIAPAGKYQMVTSTALGREVPVVGTYVPVEAQPQGITTALLAPINGLYDHRTYTTGAIDVALFVLIIGGLLGAVNKIGAVSAGIEQVTTRLNGREEWVIPTLMTPLVASGTVYGMTEEPLPFYTLLVPIMTAARFDPLIVAATMLLGSGIGTLGSTINPLATVITVNAAGIPFTQGILLRAILLSVGYMIRVYWVMCYARKACNSPESSTVADKMTENQAHLLGNRSETMLEFAPTRKAALILFVASFAFMIYGVAVLGWQVAEISAVFLAAVAIVDVTARMDEETSTSIFIDDVRDLLGVALIVGIAHDTMTVMDNGMITHTVLHSAENLVSGFSAIVFINVTCWLEVLPSFLAPSSSGLAVLAMPVMVPLTNFVHA